MRKIILLWWAPTTGKSTLAAKLSKHLDIPWISTDQIRGIMRSVAKREDYPNLFEPEWYEEANKFLEHFSAQEISNMEFEQSIATWTWINAFIKSANTLKDWYIIEWVNILPELVNKDFKDNSNIQAVFIWDNDENRIKEVVYNRWLFTKPNDYLDKYKPKEIEWVKIFYERLKKEAKEYWYPFIDIEKDDSDLENILKCINNKKLTN